MHRITRSVCCGVIAAACLLPVTGAVDAQEAAPTPPLMTVDQARAAFASAGYHVEQSYNWDWTSPPVTTFQVKDLNDRILMVLVYPSMTAAEAGRLQAQSHEQALNANPPSSADVGPHLVIGYGQSVWTGNVALVETRQSQLDRLFQAQADRDNGVYTNTDVVESPGLPTVAVDLDFQQALQSGAVNL